MGKLLKSFKQSYHNTTNSSSSGCNLTVFNDFLYEYKFIVLLHYIIDLIICMVKFYLVQDVQLLGR